MSPLAVILLAPLDSGYSLILENKMAGVPLFKRLFLTLQRAGIKEILVLSNQLNAQEIKTRKKNVEKDSRFKSLLLWHDRSQFFAATNKEQANTLAPSEPFLLPPDKFSTLSHRNRAEDVEGKAERIELPADKNFWMKVEGSISALAAEKNLLRYGKNHYKQFMDIWFNSLFSIPLSAMLVKTPITPNMVTLLGFFVGLLAGWCFAQGGYLSGVAGGVLLAFTAILDCCDGDVARLHFIESDFGETLDTTCDNLINVFIFTGMMLGVSRTQGWGQALIPFIMLIIGGGLIFVFIYFPKGGKGSFFKGSKMHAVIQTLASRNFIYVILAFAIGGHLGGFLWLAGIGSLVFALILFVARLLTKRCLKTFFL